jgi:phytoene dehydrogenase-like protein
VSRVVVVGAGVGGLAAALRCARAGHAVTVVEAAEAPGGKAGRRELGGYGFDTGPSLLTMPWVFEELLGDALPELMRVEPVTRYRFADGSTVDLSADLPRALSALEAWSPGAGDDWARFLGVCAGMWRASVPFLTGMPPWPPRRPGPDDPRPTRATSPGSSRGTRCARWRGRACATRGCGW